MCQANGAVWNCNLYQPGQRLTVVNVPLAAVTLPLAPQPRTDRALVSAPWRLGLQTSSPFIKWVLRACP